MTRCRLWRWLQPSPATRSRAELRADLEQLLFHVGQADEVRVLAGLVAYVRRHMADPTAGPESETCEQ